MEMTVDAMGDKCPVPVVKAKQALKAIDEGVVEVLVDNETAVTNLRALAESLHCEAADAKKGDAEFVVRITKTAEAVAAMAAEAPAAGQAGPAVVVISSDKMGEGDDELGAMLMKMFIFSISQLDELPETIMFYNGGARLTCEGSPALEDLQNLANAGVEILTCGTCLKHFGIEDKLQVGDVTNIFVVLEKQTKAGVVIQP